MLINSAEVFKIETYHNLHCFLEISFDPILAMNYVKGALKIFSTLNKPYTDSKYRKPN